VTPFTYERAAGPADAVAAVAGRSGAMYVAGGTNLVDHLKLGVATPDVLVDVSRLGLDRVVPVDGGGLSIGATVRNADLAAHAGIRRDYPALSQALLAGASAQIRNVATTGGNLLQRTRCVYFQDVTTPCNKREPGSGCPAVAGFHRNLAVLGASEHCVATHPSDLAVALVALDAVVVVLGPSGERRVPITDLYRLPGDRPERDTILEHGELVTAVELPDAAFAARSAYRKVRDRASFAFALVSVAAALDLDGDTVRDVRIALGGVAHRPWRATVAEEALRGRPATDERFRHAARLELEAAEPLPGNAFKVPMARNVMAATLRRLTGTLPAGGTR
jgi:xanthine dehydrogenase YagS FAD-binding subunit